MSNKKEVLTKIEFLNREYEELNLTVRSQNGYHYLYNRGCYELIGGNWNDLLYFVRGLQHAYILK